MAKEVPNRLFDIDRFERKIRDGKVSQHRGRHGCRGIARHFEHRVGVASFDDDQSPPRTVGGSDNACWMLGFSGEWFGAYRDELWGRLTGDADFPFRARFSLEGLRVTGWIFDERSIISCRVDALREEFRGRELGRIEAWLAFDSAALYEVRLPSFATFGGELHDERLFGIKTYRGPNRLAMLTRYEEQVEDLPADSDLFYRGVLRGNRLEGNWEIRQRGFLRALSPLAQGTFWMQRSA